MRRKIGILGGTFDPPHLGHLLIANEVLDDMQLDEIKFMPNQEPPHKKRESSTSGEDRLQMVKLAIQDHPRFSIEPIELERDGLSYTYETMSILKEKNPAVDYYFIIGGDMVEYLPNWHEIDKLMELVHFVGTNRPHYHMESPYPISYVNVPQMDISSSLIRERVRTGKTIKYLLPESVIDYIKGNRLYEL